MRARRLVILFAALLVAAGAFWVFRAPPATSQRRAPAPPVQEVRVDDPSTFWRREGFVEMVAPIRPPTSENMDVHIVVYLKLPEGSRIRTALREDGSPTLAYPPGTIADRVEYVGRGGIDDPPDPGWLAADVRGTQIANIGEEFHVYRPTSRSASASLAGIRWPGGSESAQSEATRTLGAWMEEGDILGPGSAAERRKSAAHLRGINDCAGCHVPNRAARKRVDDPNIVSRAADAAGFFHVPSVLFDRAPLETYRPRNANAADPYVTYMCGASEMVRPAGDLRGTVRCDGGEVPVGVLDIKAALRANDLHARRVCASRQFLYERLDEAGRVAFGNAREACEIVEN